MEYMLMNPEFTADALRMTCEELSHPPFSR
jgi:hypothetical protein